MTDTYHGKHEPQPSAAFEGVLGSLESGRQPHVETFPPGWDLTDRGEKPDMDEVLATARRQLLRWEQADFRSLAEHIAALELSAAFATLDVEATRHQNLPSDWRQPADGPKWTPYQITLVSMFGTCQSCGGPRATRFATDGPEGVRQVMYCTICGTEES